MTTLHNQPSSPSFLFGRALNSASGIENAAQAQVFRGGTPTALLFPSWVTRQAGAPSSAAHVTRAPALTAAAALQSPDVHDCQHHQERAARKGTCTAPWNKSRQCDAEKVASLPGTRGAHPTCQAYILACRLAVVHLTRPWQRNTVWSCTTEPPPAALGRGVPRLHDACCSEHAARLCQRPEAAQLAGCTAALGPAVRWAARAAYTRAAPDTAAAQRRPRCGCATGGARARRAASAARAPTRARAWQRRPPPACPARPRRRPPQPALARMHGRQKVLPRQPAPTVRPRQAPALRSAPVHGIELKFMIKSGARRTGDATASEGADGDAHALTDYFCPEGRLTNMRYTTTPFMSP